MALQYLLAPTFQFINTAGKPLSGGAYMEVYVHGTRTKYFCASDFDGTLHPFRIPLDSLGSNIVLANDTGSYDVYAYNRYGTLMMSRYNVKPGAGGGIGGTITSTDGSIDIHPTNYGVDLSVPEQQQSDWNEFRTDRPSYIRNKPNLLLKADRVSGAVSGDLAGLDGNGNLVDSGISKDDLKAAISSAGSSIQGVSIDGTALTPDANNVVDIPLATTSADGAMSADDKAKLDGIASGAEVNVIETVKVNDIPLKVTDKTVNIDLSGKADKAVPSAKGNLAGLGETGNLIDSGIPGTLDSAPTENSGNLVTSGAVFNAMGGKADKVTGATPGNFAGLDSNGNLVDSGKKASDFKTKQAAVSDPTASGNTISFIDTISQDANGEITATKKTVTVDSTYSSAGTNPVNGKAVAAAIGGLDVSSVGGDGKYISAISETDGKISAAATTMDTTPTANSTKAVTSGGIKTALDDKFDKYGFFGNTDGKWIGAALSVDGETEVKYWKLCSFTTGNWWTLNFVADVTNAAFDSNVFERKIIAIHGYTSGVVKSALEIREGNNRLYSDRGYGNIIYYKTSGNNVTIYIKAKFAANVSQFCRLVSVLSANSISNLTWYQETTAGTQPENPVKFSLGYKTVKPAGSTRVPVYIGSDGNPTACTDDFVHDGDVTSTYSSTGTAPVNGTAVAAAIGTLDVKNISGFGAGKTLATLTETDGKVAATFQDIKITKSQVSDFPTKMTPSSHTHGNITNDGKIGTTADLGIVTGTGGKVTAKDFTKASPTTVPDTTTEFISTVAQGSDGAISATKKAITPASTSAAGIVQLSSSTSSSSETMAATPKAVKDAYDDLNNKIVAQPIPTKDSDLTNDRYVRFDANNQGLTDAQKSNARTNIGAGTSNLELGETAFTAAYGNHGHGRLQNNGSLGDENWKVSSGDRIVVAKVEYNGKRGYLVPSAITFDSDEGGKVLTQSAEWKEFLPPAGDGSSVSVTPDGTSAGYDLGSSTILKVFAQKFKNLVSALKALAFKDKVTDSDVSGTISDSHIASASTWNAKQNALATQTAYSAQGSATKVPQITTNSLGQVTGISEVTISGVTPSSHASTEITYGAGTTAKYGHVKLLDGDLNGKSYTDGVAAASAHTHGQYLTSHQSITTGTRNGSIGVDGRDVDVKGLGSLAYKSTIDTGDVSSGTYGISISGTAAKATNDSTGENIANQFTGVRQSLSGLQGTVDDILTDNYFFRGVRYYYPSRIERGLTPTLDGKMLISWTGYDTSNMRIYGQLNLIVCNASSTGYWYDLQVRYYPVSGGNPKTITWTKYAPPNNDGSNIIYLPLFNYTIEVYIYKNSNKNTGAFDIYRECVLYTGVKEHVDG